LSQAFISWSGPQARVKARALRKLLEDVLPEAKVFMSDEDISAGALWLTSISGSLDESVAGVILVTPENVKNPWVHYEAGALATRVQTRMVIPLLSGLSPSDLASTPLSVFQALAISKESVLEVCISFASALGITRSREAIVRAFDKWWTDYESLIINTPDSLAKPPVTMEDIRNLISNLQSQIRAQTELITIFANAASHPSTAKTATSASSISAGIIRGLSESAAPVLASNPATGAAGSISAQLLRQASQTVASDLSLALRKQTDALGTFPTATFVTPKK